MHDRMPAVASGPFDFGRRDAHTIARLQALLATGRQAVDANQIVVRNAIGQSLTEQFVHRGVFSDFNLIGETTTVVVDKQNLHGRKLSMV